MPVDVPDSTDQGRVAGRELVKLGAIEKAGEDLSHIVGGPRIRWHYAVELRRCIARGHGGLGRARVWPRGQLGHDAPGHGDSVFVVLRQVIGDA